MTLPGCRRFPDSPGFLLWQLVNLWEQHMQSALAGRGVTGAQFVLLSGAAWMEQSGMTVSQGLLARYAKMDLMATARAVHDLEGKGLVTRVAHPTDMSFMVVSLTEEGRVLVQRALPVVEGFDWHFFRELGERLPTLMELMQQLVDSRTYKPG